MGENANFPGFSLGNMLPLDMLAEVATETLRSDPTLSMKGDSERNKSLTTLSKVCNLKRSASHGDVLTLDQISRLSDKMLLEMFSEASSDEIRKNYSYQCYLMPDKCSKIFSSFGNETKARFQIKSHLSCHISQLISESSDREMQFVAEPVHIRQKKLQEAASKKRKKGRAFKKKIKNSSPPKLVLDKKVLNPKLKGTKETENALNSEKKTPKSYNKQVKQMNGKYVTRIRINKPVSIKVKSNRIEKENHESCPSAFDELYNAIQKVDNGFSQKLQDDLDKMSGYKTFLKDLKVQEKNGISSPTIKDPLDFMGSDAVSKTVNIPPYPSVGPEHSKSQIHEECVANIDRQSCAEHQCSHDHTYTSIYGKTFNVESSTLNGESNTKHSIVNSLKDKKKSSHKCAGIGAQFIIPTPPFPYVYIPVLPYVAEIKEVGGTGKRSCNKCSRSHSIRHATTCSKRPANTSANLPPLRPKPIRFRRVNKLIIPEEMEPVTEEDDENVPLDFTENYVEERISDLRSSAEESLLKNCDDSLMSKMVHRSGSIYGEPATQAVEKKLALKCIRALRTKRKDERGPLVCQICKDKSFTAQATLMYHYRSHAGIKPFSCSVCDATFTRQHSLNYHMLIHNNKSRFVCMDCGRNFRHPSHYKEHLRRHTGETPYSCMDCSLRFKTRNTYKRHLKTRHGKILTARGIRILSMEEFNKVRTSPRKRTKQALLHHLRQPEIQWSGITFSSALEIPEVKTEPIDEEMV